MNAFLDMKNAFLDMKNAFLDMKNAFLDMKNAFLDKNAFFTCGDPPPIVKSEHTPTPHHGNNG
jgi:hypothetical protein